VRTPATGAVVLFVLALLTAPVSACDDRFIKKCEAESEAAFVAETQTLTAPAPRRKGSRVRAAATAGKPEVRRMRAPRFAVRHAPEPTPTLASEEEQPVALPESPMKRRFRGFIDPQPMTVNSFEDLRRPRLEAEHLTPVQTVPANDMNAVAPADDASAEASTAVIPAKVVPVPPPQSAAEPIVVAEAGMPAPVLAQNVEPSNNRPDGFPYHKLVLTLCAALGVASALRFIVRA
jgi:hypothetical protein